MDIGLKIRRNPNFHYIRYDPLRPTEELTHPYCCRHLCRFPTTFDCVWFVCVKKLFTSHCNILFTIVACGRSHKQLRCIMYMP